MSELTNVARPYAKAAFEFALEQKALSAWSDMLFFAAQVAKNPVVAERLQSGTATAQSEFFIQVCAEQLNEQGQNLIKVMAENHRLLALPAVFARFAELKAEFEKEITVDVISATELTATQRESIITAMSQRLARKVKLNCSVDPSIVGGMLVKAGDMVIDGSVRGKLDRLATALQS